MPTPLSRWLIRLSPTVIFLVLGWVMRTNGPQGFVHGIVDWNKVDVAKRRRAGRDVGNIAFAMVASMAGCAVFGYVGVHGRATDNLTRVIFVGGMCARVFVMLLRLRDTKRTHGR